MRSEPLEKIKAKTCSTCEHYYYEDNGTYEISECRYKLPNLPYWIDDSVFNIEDSEEQINCDCYQRKQ